jgi:exopolysaccharide biosynthesis polyprenyl glycosylphosphotransferase
MYYIERLLSDNQTNSMRNNTSLVYNVCLVIGDFLALILAFVVAYILRVSVSHRILSAHVTAHAYLAISLTLLPFWILIFALLGLYNARYYDNRFSELGRLTIGSFIGILFAISYAYIENQAIFPARLVTLYDFGLALFFVFIFRSLARGLRRELFSYDIGINNVLLVGDTQITHRLIESLANTKDTGYKVIGVVGGVKHPIKSTALYLLYQNFADAVKSAEGPNLHTIIQTELYADADRNDEILNYAQQRHISYQFVPGNSELFSGKIEVNLFHSVPVISVHQTALIGWGRVVKRLGDLLIGSVLLVLAAPIMLVVALIIRLSDHGPALFRQERLSRYDQPIRIFKFRTHDMVYNGLTPEEAFTKMGKPELIKEYRSHADSLPHDPRVSNFGHFLRNTKLDEVPQLINVVKGDISLVGPRALIPQELAQYSQKNLILSVKSGLTGLAQISGQANLSFDARRKIDLYYVQNWTFWGDIVILIKTAWIVLGRKGTR